MQALSNRCRSTNQRKSQHSPANARPGVEYVLRAPVSDCCHMEELMDAQEALRCCITLLILSHQEPIYSFASRSTDNRPFLAQADNQPTMAKFPDIPLSKHSAARVLMSVLFLVSGTGKLGNVETTQQYMEAYGVPGYLIWPAAALEINGGLMLLVGVGLRSVGVVLSGWCLLTAMIFHRDLKDQTQQIMFMKNLAMAGGFLVLSDVSKDSWPFIACIRLTMRRRKVRHPSYT